MRNSLIDIHVGPGPHNYIVSTDWGPQCPIAVWRVWSVVKINKCFSPAPPLHRAGPQTGCQGRPDCQPRLQGRGGQPPAFPGLEESQQARLHPALQPRDGGPGGRRPPAGASDPAPGREVRLQWGQRGERGATRGEGGRRPRGVLARDQRGEPRGGDEAGGGAGAHLHCPRLPSRSGLLEEGRERERE